MKLHTGGRLAATAAVAVAALVLAGCGGKTTDNQNKTTSTNGLHKDESLAAKVTDGIRKKGKLVIAADATYPPNEFSNDGGKTFVGMDVDLGNAIGKLLGLKVTFVNASFDGILAGVQAGKYDLAMSSFTDTAEREKIVDFVTYFKAGTSIAVRKGNPLGITSEADLCGVKVAVERGTTQLDELTKDKDPDGNPTLKAQCAQSHRKVPVAVPETDQNGVNSALVSGRADAFTADSPVVAYQVKITNGGIEQGGVSTGVAPYGIAIPKGTGSFRDAVLGAVKKLMADGQYGKILDTWGLRSGAITDPKIDPASGGA
ncbi:MAG TPA: ABC transporter substrate-binding protein [Mycobacteriales bacterium]|nr:ABC transporter substrate-binding protein [Mycobacteriales bacterium]